LKKSDVLIIVFIQVVDLCTGGRQMFGFHLITQTDIVGFLSNLNTIYNYGPLWRDTSRIVSLGRVIFPRAKPSGKNNPSQGDNSGCIPTKRAIIVLSYRNKNQHNI